jgi:FlaA1/EpsC-like NDP-sugar epimerase
VRVEELLGREPVPPIPELMSKTTSGRSVMVTGAGGSIGSELCRQILDHRPKRLVLFDVSEYALYRIHEELTERLAAACSECELLPVLGSVVRKDLVARTITENTVETLFHAAAYKHVSLVEANVLEGVRNNVFGTEAVAEAAGELGVKNFTLISTDKAVRPTNVMGATKRLAELVMQAKAQTYLGTKYCAVRFGNVLGSSGSVIPKFEKQIATGGPITLTHPEITRYFMTIPEAAQLVVQASAMATRGEIYLLDMGEPVKILDLAKTMARLHGRPAHLEGEDTGGSGAIRINVTGLRPGEKLYEELLVDGRQVPTDHPRVMCEISEPAAMEVINGLLKQINGYSQSMRVVELLSNAPLDFTPTDKGNY